MKKITLLIVLLTLAFTVFSSVNMFKYSIYYSLASDRDNQSLMAEIVVVEDYTFEFKSNDDYNTLFLITPRSRRGNTVNTSIRIKQNLYEFSNNFNLAMGDLVEITQIETYINNVKRDYVIYVQVNTLEEFNVRKTKVQKSKFDFTYNTEYFRNNNIQTQLSLNNMMFLLMDIDLSAFDLENFTIELGDISYGIGIMMNDLQVGVKRKKGQGVSVFLKDEARFDNFISKAYFQPGFINRDFDLIRKIELSYSLDYVIYDILVFGGKASYIDDKFALTVGGGIIYSLSDFELLILHKTNIFENIHNLSVNLSYSF